MNRRYLRGVAQVLELLLALQHHVHVVNVVQKVCFLRRRPILLVERRRGHRRRRRLVTQAVQSPVCATEGNCSLKCL